MTLHLRRPGPLGALSRSGFGRYPGPLGIGPGVYMSPNQSGGSPKLLPLPLPAGDNKTKVASNMRWTAFPSAPAMGDVQQQVLLNCPIAAVLAAYARTEAGRKLIRGMVTVRSSSVETDISKLPSDVMIEGYQEDDEEDEKAKRKSTASRPKVLASSRHFTVTLGIGSVDVSPVFYTDESRDPNPVYMTSPKNALWPCLVEKAYAQHLGGYAALNSPGSTTANKIWEDIIGKAPGAIEIKTDTGDDEILEVARGARTRPTIAASTMGTSSDSGIQGYHGFVVLGLKPSRKAQLLQLYDADALETKELSLETFRANFSHMLFASS